MSAKGCRCLNPLARFLTILTIRLIPSATALVTPVSTKARIPAWWRRRVATNLRSGSRRLRKAEVVHRLKNRSAAHGALKFHSCSNSSLSRHAR